MITPWIFKNISKELSRSTGNLCYFRWAMLMMRHPYSQHRITSSQLVRILRPAYLLARCRLPTPTLPTLSATIYHSIQATIPSMSQCSLIRYVCGNYNHYWQHCTRNLNGVLLIAPSDNWIYFWPIPNWISFVVLVRYISFPRLFFILFFSFLLIYGGGVGVVWGHLGFLGLGLSI